MRSPVTPRVRASRSHARVCFASAGAEATSFSSSCRATPARPVSTCASASVRRAASANGLCGYRRRSSLYASYTTGHAPTGTAPAPTLSKTSSAASSAGNSSASRLENSRAPVQSFSSTAIPART